MVASDDVVGIVGQKLPKHAVNILAGDDGQRGVSRGAELVRCVPVRLGTDVGGVETVLGRVDDVTRRRRVYPLVASHAQRGRYETCQQPSKLVSN